MGSVQQQMPAVIPYFARAIGCFTKPGSFVAALAIGLLAPGCATSVPHADTAALLEDTFATAGWAVAAIDDPLRFAVVAQDQPGWDGATCFRAVKDHRAVEVCVHAVHDPEAAREVEWDAWRASTLVAPVPVVRGSGDLTVIVTGACNLAVGDAWCIVRAAVGEEPASCAAAFADQLAHVDDHYPLPVCTYGTGSFWTTAAGERVWVPDHDQDGFVPSDIPVAHSR
jgi:hypothetical protein